MNILVVAYHFPPPESDSSERAAVMAKYLPGFGHQVRVLTHSFHHSDFTDPACIRIFDYSHQQEHGGIHLPFWLCYRLAVKIFNCLGFSSSIFSLWKRNVLRHSHIIMQQRPDLIIAAYPPAECLDIGLHLSKKYRIPLVADFLEGFLFEPLESKKWNRFRCLQRYSRKLEGQVMEAASAVITGSPPLSSYFCTQYTHPDVTTIVNGYDEDDYEMVPSSMLDLELERFHIVHTGVFGRSDPGCDIAPFVQALRQLFCRKEDLKHKIRIHLIGVLSKRDKRLLQEFLDAGIVTCYPMHDHQTALALQMKADLLLLFTCTQRSSAAPSKLFEYLRSGRPILALSGRTYAAQLLEETGTGWAVDAGDAAAISELLERIVCHPAFYASIQPDREQIEKIISFSSLNQMQKLNAVIKSITGKG